MKKFLTVLMALAFMLTGAVAFSASPAAAHTGCDRYLDRPVRHDDGKIYGYAAMRCAPVYDPDPNSHKAGTRHSMTMECASRVEIKIRRIGRPDAWQKMGTSSYNTGSRVCTTRPWTNGMYGRQDYRTRLTVKFYGNMGPVTQTWYTGERTYTRDHPPR